MPAIRPHKTNPTAVIVDITVDGRRQPVVCYTVEQALETIVKDPSFQGFKSPPPFTLEQLCSRFIRRCIADDARGPDTVRRYLGYATKVLGTRQASEIGSAEIMSWASGLMRGGGNANHGMSYSTVAEAVARLGEVYREAIQLGLLDYDPTAPVRQHYPKPKVGVATRFLSPALEETLMACIGLPTDRLLVRLFTETGLSQLEIAPLRHCHFETDRVGISVTIDENGNVTKATDYGQRMIPLSAAIVGDLLACRLQTGACSGDLVFESLHGGLLSASGIKQRVSKILCDAGLGRTIKKSYNGMWVSHHKADFSCTELASTAAVKWLLAGVNPVLVQRRMGYGSYKSFRHRYRAHLNALPPGPDISAVDDLIWGAAPDEGTLPTFAKWF